MSGKARPAAGASWEPGGSSGSVCALGAAVAVPRLLHRPLRCVEAVHGSEEK